jgi:hypothetical protein
MRQCWDDEIAALPAFLLHLELLSRPLERGKGKTRIWAVAILFGIQLKVELVRV